MGLHSLCTCILNAGHWSAFASPVQQFACTLSASVCIKCTVGWHAVIHIAPRAALLALRRELPALRESGRATSPSSVPAHERLFFQAPDDVFSHIIKFWRSDRDSRY